jgi:hypothetical protein
VIGLGLLTLLAMVLGLGALLTGLN